MPTTSITQLTTSQLMEVLDGTYMEGDNKPYSSEDAVPEIRYRFVPANVPPSDPDHQYKGGVRPTHEHL